MEWRDEGLIIGVKAHGESGVILETMTRAHGRCLGLVRGGRSRRMRPLLQPGNSAEFVWRARLDDHLGVFAVELTELRAARLINDAQALHAVGLLCALLRLAAERDPHPALYDLARLIVDRLDDARVPARLARFELEILREAGFGLDLTRCAATGSTEDLAFVSPKSGRAVSRAAAEPYRNRLLKLPSFLSAATARDPGLIDPELVSPDLQNVVDGFRLTGFFLDRDVYAPRGRTSPDARRAFLAGLLKHGAEAGAWTSGDG